jgi:phage-related protein
LEADARGGFWCAGTPSSRRKRGVPSLYVAKFQEAVYVLHVFEKRSQKTAMADLELGKSRYADLLKWRREEGL